jgi:hypothetical protein
MDLPGLNHSESAILNVAYANPLRSGYILCPDSGIGIRDPHTFRVQKEKKRKSKAEELDFSCR